MKVQKGFDIYNYFWYSYGSKLDFFYEAYDRIGVSIASLLYYCGPVIVMILSPFIFKEKLTIIKILGFSIVVCGIFLVNDTIFNQNGDLFGIVCGLMSALVYSVMVMANKKSTYIKGLENSTLQLTVSFCTVAIFVFINGDYNFDLSSGDFFWICILGFVNTVVGCYFYFSSISNLPVQTVAICGYLEPLSAVIFSVIILGEKMSFVQVIGAILIMGGAILGESRNFNFKKVRQND